MNDDHVHIEDPTPVIPAREYLRDAIGHLAGTMRSTASTLDEARGVLGAVAGGGPGDEAVLGELDQVLDDVRHVATGAKRALRRYRNLKPTESADDIRRPDAMTTTTEPPVKKANLLVRVIQSPVVHVLLPIGVVGYMRYTSGNWPTIEQIGIGAALLLARIQAAAELVSKYVVPSKGEVPEPPKPETPPTNNEG